MKTTLTLATATVLALAAIAVVPSANAENPCNGLYDTDCICGYNWGWCSNGEKCHKSVNTMCVDGSEPSGKHSRLATLVNA